ncbi:MAG: class I SAM-dependent methyltransferase [Chloroflexi bacterium]|nr:class I SAM-dependent methyltransferase [Chloroflexota bacterium]
MTAATAEWYEQSPIYHGRRGLSLPLPVYQLDWRYRTLLSLKLRPGGRLLDVGCGTGNLVRLARKRGYRVAGTDYDREAVAVARKSFALHDVHALSIEETVAHDWQGPFDVITLFDVLEHLAEPRQAIESLSGLLAPGGFLACTVPSAQRWPGWFDSVVDSPPHHLTLWTRPGLASCIAAAGLAVRGIKRSPLQGFDMLHPLQSVWRPLSGRVPLAASLGLAASYGVALVAAPILQAARPGAGGFTLLAVGQKVG